MKSFIPRRGATLLIASGPKRAPNKKHLFVLLTDPVDVQDEKTRGKCVLLVNLSSVLDESSSDDTCILKPGEHAFVRRKSFVVYERARITPISELISGINSGFLVAKEDMDRRVIDKIRYGLEKSPHVKKYIRKFYYDNL